MSVLCSVCLDDLNFAEDRISVTKCGHIFHKRCLNRWTSRNHTCPECRKRVYWKNTVNRLYANVNSTDRDSTCINHVNELQNVNSNLQLQLSDCFKQIKILKESNVYLVSENESAYFENTNLHRRSIKFLINNFLQVIRQSRK